MVAPRELTAEEMQSRLASLPGWQLVASPGGRAEAADRVELVKSFEFASFDDAMRFMHEAVPAINERDHHPRWENSWRTVTVHLSTWDIGHRPSERDFELARFLETHRTRFAPPHP